MPPQGVEPRVLPCKGSVLPLHHGSSTKVTNEAYIKFLDVHVTVR